MPSGNKTKEATMHTVNKRKIVFSLVAGVLVYLATSLPSYANWANPQLLISPQDVEANIDKPDWVVVDARDLKDYLKGHIPGAISLGGKLKKVLRDPSARVFTDVSRYETLFGKAGIDNNTHVVFYHGDIKDLDCSTVAFWVMEYLGHDKVQVLDGGIDAWRNAGYRLDTKPTIKPEKSFKAHMVPSRLATNAEILEIATGKETGKQLIDSRTAKEYKGEDIRTIKGGHVPHVTMNVSHLDTLRQEKDPKTEKMKAVAYLDYDNAVKAFGNLDKNVRTIGYCQTGTRSTLTYLELRLLGFKDPANWDESWRIWADDLYANYPIEAPNGVQYYNFDHVNKELKKLAKKVADLEAKLAPAAAAK